MALQPLCGTGHRQPAAPHGNSGWQGVVGLGEVIHAAAQILNPLDEFTHGWPLHGRAVLGNDHVDGQIAHHVGPQPQHLGRHHVAAVEALHLGNVPRQRRDRNTGIAGLDHRHAQVTRKQDSADRIPELEVALGMHEVCRQCHQLGPSYRDAHARIGNAHNAPLRLARLAEMGGKTLPQFGDIELKNISFAYEEGKPILDGVSVIFTKGSKTAIIGRNGSGKTTIINLLTRLYEPENGQILLNGTNIADMSLQAYREMVSIVSQQIYLFNDSIRNNICLYKQVSDAMLKIACRDSGLEDFIKEVSLDYVVGQNGAMLSGGQKQKIALARALIHDKPIIIFDEATSNTDAYSEQQINALLHTGLRDKTVIVITHKKEVLSEVDQIVVLDDGKIDIVGGYEAVKKSKYWLQLRDDYVDI